MEENSVIIRKWLENQCDKKYWSDYLQTYHYSTIAIYGCGELGKYMARDLKDTPVKVSCFIDQKAEALRNVMGIPVLTLKDFLSRQNGTDAIIVSVLRADRDILEQVCREDEKMPVMSLRDMIYEL